MKQEGRLFLLGVHLPWSITGLKVRQSPVRPPSPRHNRECA